MSRTMGEFDGSFSLSSLMCQEDEACLIQEIQDDNTYDLKCNYDPSFVLANGDEEYMQKLVERETGFGSKSCGFSNDCSARTESWLKCARLDAIEWIFNTRATFGFQHRTAYLSVDYFDRFLSKRCIDDGKLWAIRLLSVACLSLAAKMEECKVPALSEFRVEDFDFESKVIQRMELLVLCTLEWKMGSITPFAFLHHFISKFCGECRPKELVSRAVELIMTITKEINLMHYRPSFIAAAAVLAAFDGQLTRETMEVKMNVISALGSLEIEHVYFCYNLMHEIEMGKLNTPKSVVSRKLSSTSSIDVLENSAFASGVGTKRRLTYNDCACPSKKLCPP
ncbi:cyclin-D5-1-like [Melia azedarach]|uniref:Cyclin-D5-1-like n=1 Tax=Melia azedarach TaxID=155640 RepID=A0ACC1XVH7_MELAZ|nr:cyclin-D5-1-like [Melia azedarach]